VRTPCWTLLACGRTGEARRLAVRIAADMLVPIAG
jgi:hypothetical protein